MERLVISVMGRNSVGIISGICKVLSDANVNILDISQTIVSGIFNMLMIGDASQCNMDFETLNANLRAEGDLLGVTVVCQREEIFDKMHRI